MYNSHNHSVSISINPSMVQTLSWSLKYVQFMFCSHNKTYHCHKEWKSIYKLITNDLYTFKKLSNKSKRAHQWNCYIKKSQSFDFNMDSTGDSKNIKTVISLTPTVKICMSIDSQALLLWGLRNGVCVCVCVCARARACEQCLQHIPTKKEIWWS